EDAIAGGNRPQLGEVLVLRLPRRKRQGTVGTNARGDRIVDERVHGRRAHHLQHLGGVFRTWSDVAGLERFGIENAHFTRSAYWDASSRLSVAVGSASLILIIQLACGLPFT